MGSKRKIWECEEDGTVRDERAGAVGCDEFFFLQGEKGIQDGGASGGRGEGKRRREGGGGRLRLSRF